ncbi:MAG: response regulator transcription factor [Planctomycetaceae bacterium]
MQPVSLMSSSGAEVEIPVVLVADNRLLLEALPDNRGPLAGIQIVGRSMDIPNGRELVRRMMPRLMVIDGTNFCQGFRQLGEDIAFRLGQTRLVVFADGFSDTRLELAISSGVRGLLSQQDSLMDLGASLRAIASGEQRVSQVFQDRATFDQRSGKIRVHRRHRLQSFSDRQLEVLMQLAEGKRVKDIADSMSLSEKAIESHKYRLMNRLGIHDRVELCRWAIREGLISA